MLISSSMQFIWTDFGDNHISWRDNILHCFMHLWFSSVRIFYWQHAGIICYLLSALTQFCCGWWSRSLFPYPYIKHWIFAYTRDLYELIRKLAYAKTIYSRNFFFFFFNNSNKGHCVWLLLTSYYSTVYNWALKCQNGKLAPDGKVKFVPQTHYLHISYNKHVGGWRFWPIKTEKVTPTAL